MDPDEVRRQWETRSGEYSPAYYAHYGPDGTSETIRRTFDGLLGRSAEILELGCSSGRHLAHLHGRGYGNLSGIDLNGDAFDVMAGAYPGLAEAGTFHHDTIENAIRRFETGRFDAVYSVETLQHIHPDTEWVFGEIARIADGVVLTAENEGDGDVSPSAEPEVNYVMEDVPLYYRNWQHVFADCGFVQTDVAHGKRDTVRTFVADR